MNYKVALFDFDDTLLKKDTIFHLLVYYTKKHPLAIFQWVKIGFYFILYGVRIISFLSVKQQILYPIKKMTQEQLREFYQNDLIPRYYPHVVERMKKHKKDGYIIFLVSASPEAYLFETDLPVDYIIGTKLKKENRRFTNIIISKNCKHQEKVVRINEVLINENIVIDYDHSYGYSDSTTDLPMLELVKHKVRIDKKDGSFATFD